MRPDITLDISRATWLCGVLVLLAALPAAAQTTVPQIGMWGVTRQVSSLEASMRFYLALGMQLTSGPTPWSANSAEAKLFATRRAQWRSATLVANSALYDDQFRLILREFRGVARRDFGRMAKSEVGSSHIGFAFRDPENVWEALRSQGLLRPKSVGGRLVVLNRGGAGFGLMSDPDGLNVEIKGAGISNDSLTAREGFTHSALVVANIYRSKTFYESLGLKFPGDFADWRQGPFFENAWSLPAGTRLRVTYAYGPAATNARPVAEGLLHGPTAQMPIEFVEFKTLSRRRPGSRQSRYFDIGVHSVIYRVNGIDQVYSHLRRMGATVWSVGGVTTLPDGQRSVILRDPDAAGFIQLIE